MGTSSSVPHNKIYAVDDSGDPNESQIFRNIVTKVENGGQLIPTFRCQPKSRSPIQILAGSAMKYRDKPCLGERCICTTGSYGKYEWKSFRDVLTEVSIFAGGLKSIGVTKGMNVGLASVNCLLWQISFFSINALFATAVTVSDILSAESMIPALKEAKCEVVIIGKDRIDTLLKNISKLPDIKKVILLNSEVPEISDTNVTFYTVNDINQKGRDNKIDLNYEKLQREQDQNDTCLIMFTSGSTNEPKGCMLSNINVVAGSSGFSDLGSSITTGDIFISYIPLSHVYEVVCELIMVAQGAAIGYYTGTSKYLMDDIKELRPTIVCGFPRLWNKLSDSFHEQMDKLGTFQKVMLEYALSMKIESLKRSECPSLLFDVTILKSFREILGGRVRLIVSGGAPMRPDVFEFLKSSITPNIVQGYGLTEASGCVSLQGIPSELYSSVGNIAPCCEMKLRTVPGMQYNPRAPPQSGEIMIRGYNVFKGYFNDEKATNEVLQNGWLATGDIGQIIETGEIQIVDRVSNLVKLSHGEYISISSITNVVEEVDAVKSVFVFADSHYDAPVAVVVPSERLSSLWHARGITELTKSEAAAEEIKERINRHLQERNCSPCELLAKVLIEEADYTELEDDISPMSFKARYGVMRKKYEARIMEMLR